MVTSYKKAGECLYRNISSGTYYALLKVRGKQIRASLKTSNLVEAKRKLADYRRDVGRIDVEAQKITISGLADRYLETVQHQAPATIRKKSDIAKLIKEKWGPLPAKNLNSQQIKAWLSSFPFGPASYNKYLRVIRAMLDLAVEDRLIAASGAERIKERSSPRPIRHTPTLSEFAAIVASIRNQPLSDTAAESSDFVEFFGLAGLGLAETGSLTWGDVSFERGQIITFRNKTEKGFAIPIFPQLRPLLEKRHALAVKANGGKSPLPKTKVFSVANAKKALKAACDRLGLPSYSSRAFRRMFISTAIERGVDVKVIAEWQGHKDGGKLILDTYSHVRPAHSEQMAKLMTVKTHANAVPMEGSK
jgi:integrase